MLKLTARQEDILRLIEVSLEKTGLPPTRAEIAKIFNFKSVNSAEEHLRALCKKGMIDMTPGIARGIKLLQTVDAVKSGETYLLPLLTKPPIDRQYQDVIETRYTFDSAFFSQKPDYLLRMFDASMQALGIMNGDLLAIKKAKRIANNDIVVAWVSDKLMIRRYRRSIRKIELMKSKDDKNPLVLTGNSPLFLIEGKVVGVVRRIS